MSRRVKRISLSLLALSFLALTSCGKSDKPPAFQAAKRSTHTVPEDIGRLVPQDAVVFAHVSSLSGLETKVKDLVRSFRPGAENMVGLDEMFRGWPVKARDVDASKSAGVALKMGQMGPEPILIVPAKSAKDLVDISDAAVASGSYVGLGQMGEPSVAETASSLGNQLPDGDVAVRVRLDKVLEPLRPQFETFLDPEALAQMNPGAQNAASKAGMQFVVDWVKKLLDHAKTLEASVSLNEGKLDLGFVFKAGQGSPLDAGPARQDRNLPYLAGSLPMPDASMVYLLSGAAQMQEAFGGMYEEMAKDLPQREAEQFLAAMKKSQEFYKNMEDDMVMALDFTPNGLQAVALMRAKDPEKFTKEFDSVTTENIKAMHAAGMFGVEGMSVTLDDPVTVSGVEFKVFTMKMDFAKMMEAQGTPLPKDDRDRMGDIMGSVLGKDGLKYAMGLDGKDVIMVMGDIEDLGAKTITALRENKRYKLATIDAAVGRLHVNPACLFAVDVRRFLKSIRSILPNDMLAKMPPVPQGAPVPVWFAAAADGPVYDLQVHVDLAGIADMVKAMTPQRPR